MENKKSHVISAIVEHKSGVLSNFTNLFRRRRFNIESLSVGPIRKGDLARITVTVKADDKIIEQIIKQLNKLVDVITVSRLDPENMVSREMMLIKVFTKNTTDRASIINYVDVFRGRIVDVSSKNLMIEITGRTEKIDAFIDLMRTFGIKEIARTGLTALSRELKFK